MAELINLRSVRKQAKRRESEQLAEANRLAHGQPKHVREHEDAKQQKANGDLDRHRIETGD